MEYAYKINNVECIYIYINDLRNINCTVQLSKYVDSDTKEGGGREEYLLSQVKKKKHY